MVPQKGPYEIKSLRTILIILVILAAIISLFLPLNIPYIIKLAIGYSSVGFGYIIARVVKPPVEKQIEAPVEKQIEAPAEKQIEPPAEKQNECPIMMPSIKETMLASINCTVKLSDNTYSWLDSIPEKDRSKMWFNKHNEAEFFHRYESELSEMFAKAIQEDLSQFFLNQNISMDNLLKVKIYKINYGSIQIFSDIAFLAPLAVAYELLKIALELWENTNKTKQMLQTTGQALENKFNKFIRSKLELIAPNPPQDVATSVLSIKSDNISYVISSFKNMDTHKIQLQVDLSRDKIKLTNLSEDELALSRIGIFKNDTPQNEWIFPNSYQGNSAKIGPMDNISLNVSDFVNCNKVKLNIPQDLPSYIDCWLEDIKGIYLVKFLLIPGSFEQTKRLELALAIDGDAITLCNTAIDPSSIIKNINLGIFKSKAKKTNWYYIESYQGMVDALMPHHTVRKNFNEFKNSTENTLMVKGEIPLCIDCWVEDQNNSICVFLLYLKV
ncbi:MAG: hypothetical protein NTX42_10160 [Methanothrix sp.]|nr:hypothetical protein [Methanothrix sp.]